MEDKILRVEARLKSFKAQSSRDRAIVASLEGAIDAGKSGNYPCGAVITDSQFNIIARGRNSVFKPKFHSAAHAEMNTITALENSGAQASEDLILITSLEPCMMCAARILFAKIPHVIYVQEDPTASISEEHLPENFATLRERTKYEQYSGDKTLKELAKELYEIGEALWESGYGI
jgi:tRNA(Arg) A34 adenosine deaminase TadA